MEIPRRILQFAVPLPKSPHSTIHVHLTVFTTCSMLFLTTGEAEGPGHLAPMGSFVYAMPNVSHLALVPDGLAKKRL